MERNNNHNQHNGSGNGFLLGVIVGVLLTLLFTTKRGRAILKDVMDRGVEKFSNLEQLMRETEKNELIEEEFEEEGDDFIPTENAGIEQTEKTEQQKKTEEPEQIRKEPVDESRKGEQQKTTKVKRLFRGLRKKK